MPQPPNYKPELAGVFGQLVAENPTIVMQEAAFRALGLDWRYLNTDIIANATSIGLFPNVDEQPDIDYNTITATMIVCDVIPNPPQTPFLRRAAERGARTLDGLGMLVYQGAIGFKMWSGQDAPVTIMRQALADEFGVA